MEPQKAHPEEPRLLRTQVPSEKLLRSQNRHQDHQNHHQDHQNHSQDHQHHPQGGPGNPACGSGGPGGGSGGPGCGSTASSTTASSTTASCPFKAPLPPRGGGQTASVRDETKMKSSRMNPPPSGLVWSWIWRPSKANLRVKVAMLGCT